MVVEIFEVIVRGFSWLYVVLGGFRSFLLLVLTIFFHQLLSALSSHPQ